MKESPRCLYHSTFTEFLRVDENAILGLLCDHYHGDARTTTREAWKGEISIMRELVRRLDHDGRIIFEYDIPRLGKRIDVVLLLRGIIFCLEFKVGESKILEADVDQVLDYALDLKNFHEFSQEQIIVPVLIKALNEMFPHWNVYISPKLTDAEYAEGKVNALLKDNPNVTYSESLHLAVSLRSYRAEKLSAFVHALLSFDDSAAAIYQEIKDKYPIMLTRDMTAARKWLHEKVRGTEYTVFCSHAREPAWSSVFPPAIRTKIRAASGRTALACPNTMTGLISI